MATSRLRRNSFIWVHINWGGLIKGFRVFLSALVKAVMGKGYGCKREEDSKGQEKYGESS